MCRRVATSCWWSLLSRVVRHVAVSARGRPLSPQENDARGSFIFIFCCILFFLHPLRGNRVCALQQRPRDLRPLSLALQSAVSIALSSSSRRELPSPSVTWWGQRGGSPAENLSVQHFPNTPAALLLSLPSAKCIYFKVLSSRFIFFFFSFFAFPPHDAIVAIVVVMPGAAGGNQPEQKKKRSVSPSSVQKDQKTQVEATSKGTRGSVAAASGSAVQ